MHLFKAKATLFDYFDLNKRYIKITNIILFEDDRVKLDILPKYFFNSVADKLYADAYYPSKLLFDDCHLENISKYLIFDKSNMLESINNELGINLNSIEDVRIIIEDERYKRFNYLVDTKFTDEKILLLLDYFEKRKDADIRNMVTDNADVWTIFEYVLGIIWYKISGKEGKILDYLKLSLDADLLPKTHATGGQADIVYEYIETKDYPTHNLLLEATLCESTNQRRMEMEPVSRHLGNHLIQTSNCNSYCIFVTTQLNINVISDFRHRKLMPYYNSQDHSKMINSMKIIPLATSELKKIVINKKEYKQLYKIFEKAYNNESLVPNEWYSSYTQSL
jgi:hypothetical protein